MIRLQREDDPELICATPVSGSTPARKFQPGPVLLLGAPGAGKGTQAHRLISHLQVPQVSTGDLLRRHVRAGTELGKQAKQLMDLGRLVPDELVNDMVKERLGQSDCATGYILDGFPRTKCQAEWLDQMVAARGDPSLVAIQIKVPREDLLQRITGRRICSACQHIYNLYSHPPQIPNICDVEGSALLHRSDDTEEAFYKRMEEYVAKTAAVVEHYRLRGHFSEVDGKGPAEDVARNLISAIRKLRAPDKLN